MPEEEKVRPLPMTLKSNLLPFPSFSVKKVPFFGFLYEQLDLPLKSFLLFLLKKNEENWEKKASAQKKFVES